MDNPTHLETAETDEPQPGAHWHIEHVAVTASTQTDLVARSDRGALIDRTVLVTDHQEHGRGRLDRRWDAPPGTNLLVSIGFVDVPDDPTALMRRTSVALVGTLDEFGIEGANLKWPNDVLIGQRKVAGMLAQRTQSGAVVVGFGVNVGWAPDGAVALVDVVPAAPTPLGLLRRVLARFDESAVGFEDLYRQRLGTIGSQVSVDLGGQPLANRRLEGTATGVAQDGALLIVDDKGDTHQISAGDVVHLRPRRRSGG